MISVIGETISPELTLSPFTANILCSAQDRIILLSGDRRVEAE